MTDERLATLDGVVHVDGVLFDIDDTLVDTRAAFGAAMEAVADRYLTDLDADRRAGLVAFWRADEHDRYAQFTRGEVSHRTQRMGRANDLHRAFGGAELDDEAYEAWDELFDAAFAAAWAAHPEAADVVEELVAAGLAVGALSNADVAYQTRKLEVAGLGERVPMLVGTDTLGFGKPDPRVFLEACRRLGTDPARTVYVGDELDVDAHAAVGAGLVGVWVDRPGGRRRTIPEADIAAARAAGVHVVTSLTELPAVLRR
ncbi:HAD family hydrolase [Cellulomonas sp. NPDC055163]